MKLLKLQNNKEKIDHLIDKLVNKDKCAICGQYTERNKFIVFTKDGKYLICPACMSNYHTRDLHIKLQQIKKINKYNNLKRIKFFRFIKDLFFYYFKW